jgi:hypothetical protein
MEGNAFVETSAEDRLPTRTFNVEVLAYGGAAPLVAGCMLGLELRLALVPPLPVPQEALGWELHA